MFMLRIVHTGALYCTCSAILALSYTTAVRRHVYTRVFLTEGAASTWYAWNRERGDPSQPFHYQV